MTIFFERLTILAELLNTSIYAIGKKAGISKGTIGKWRDKSTSWENVVKISLAHDVSTDFLLGRSNDPYSHKNVNLFRDAAPEFVAAYKEFSNKLEIIVHKYNLPDELDNLPIIDPTAFNSKNKGEE